MQWYADAMRLWKRGPAVFCALALVVLAVNLALSIVPVVGVALSQLVTPLLECGLLYAVLAADRGDRPRLRHLIAIAGAPAQALAAVIAAGFLIFATQAVVAQAIGDVSLLSPASNAESFSGAALVATYAAGMAVSLPLTFVPFAVLFDGDGVSERVRAKRRGVQPQRRAAASLRRAVVRAAHARPRDQWPRAAAGVAMVGCRVVCGMERYLRRRVIQPSLSALSYINLIVRPLGEPARQPIR